MNQCNLSFSGRVGIWPEITVLELRRGNNESVEKRGGDTGLPSGASRLQAAFFG
jgi:hypothetical protein